VILADAEVDANRKEAYDLAVAEEKRRNAAADAARGGGGAR
jgi:hypothetical protein